MMILRSLIDANVKALIENTNITYRERYYIGLSNAIYYYMNIQKKLRNIPEHPSIGVVTVAFSPEIPAGGASFDSGFDSGFEIEDVSSPTFASFDSGFDSGFEIEDISSPPAAITVPGNGTGALETKISSKDSLLNAFLDNILQDTPLSSPETHQILFNVLSDWLNQTTKVSLSTNSIPSTLQGSGVCTFPMVRAIGANAWQTLKSLGESFQVESSIDFYEMLSNFIFLGLQLNYTAPIMTLGQAIPNTGPYSGATIIKPWNFQDVLDWEVGEATIPIDMLILLGISGFMNIYGEVTDVDALLQAQIESDEENNNLVIEDFKCDLQFIDDEFFANDSCDDEIIGDILDGNITDPPFDTSAFDTLTSASLDNINDNYLNTSADDRADYNIDLLRTAVPEFSSTIPLDPVYEAFQEQVYSFNININIGQPEVSAVYTPEPINNVVDGSVFQIF